jgi:hypothetical protein
VSSLFASVVRRSNAAITGLFDKIVGSHDYPWLSHLYDLSAYAYVAAALLVLSLLVRRKPVDRVGMAVVLVAALTVGACYWLRDNIEDRVGIGRLQVLSAMRQRPTDPWPRGTSHAVLGRLGSTELEKAYLEPGGSFSPSPGTFGVSFWIVDQSGALIATSDDIPLARTHATYEVSASGEPAIRTETPYYSALLIAKDDASLELVLEGPKVRETRIEVVFRGVGPAAGPLTTVGLAGETIHVGTEWSVGPVTAQQLMYMGDEDGSDWKRPHAGASPTSVRSANGWAVARVAMGNGPAKLSFRPRHEAPIPARLPHLQWSVTLQGADPDFTASLQAQLMTLGMGLVGEETRPGEPLNYPLEWLRDGAYVTVALARAGQHEIATRLALAAASKDFFGGFGAEGDSPGVGIWMLAETAEVVRDPAFDRAIWPHVMRKVQLIQRMLPPNPPFVSDFVGPIVPKYRNRTDLRSVTDAPRHGLIDGRMDLHRPLFYVNAASYTGLSGAARIAERLGKIDLAKDWERAAADLRRSWNTAFVDPAMSDDVANDRTAISGLWPSAIAEKSSFEEMMNRRWESQRARWSDPAHMPLWSYFSVAEAHQWVRLDRPDRAWTILNHLWSKQRFPDLYLLWEGIGEENSFGRWGPMRGWVSPPHIVPHYWSAAEMLLLQLAMLAEVRREGPTEELVIGSGVPPEWLSRNLSFKGIGTPVGTVDWAWNGVDVSVTLSAPSSLPIRLGSSFPASAKIELK